MTIYSDYHARTMKEMCAVGYTLRAQAVRQSQCIQAGAWLRDGVTPLERSNMIELAKDASEPQFTEAFLKWQEHYAACPVCQEALRP